jgi:hypothetical protein
MDDRDRHDIRVKAAFCSRASLRLERRSFRDRAKQSTINDVVLYRELLRRGISDYLISPVGVLDVVRSICGLFSAPDAKPVGRIIAVMFGAQ